MSFLNLPNEIILQIAQDQAISDLHSLLVTNRRLACLLQKTLIDTVFRTRSAPHGKRLLLQIARTGDVAAVRNLFDRQILRFAAGDDNALLNNAVVREPDVAVRTLIEAGISVNSKEKTGDTPLMRAIWSGNESMVRLLLGYPHVDVNCLNDNHETAFHLACVYGSEGMMKAFLEREELEVNVVNRFSWRPIHVVVGRDQVGMVRALLAHPRLEINVLGLNRWTPLHCAARRGVGEIVRLLLEDGRLDINAKCSPKDRTPLVIAVYECHASIVEMLLNDKRIDLKLSLKSLKVEKLKTSTARKVEQALQNRGLLGPKRKNVSPKSNEEESPVSEGKRLKSGEESVSQGESQNIGS
ncbi:ankyrin [Choiromyces venosus 120613-1]|uniref:Ankyrin n=1 Tax=Choiromyces venosus 120613-1 TaxID=1336337 RepID=A0A3N4JN73_9PEZI|nr:ankyrin [Choiromyces venosus 120613-1]